MQNQVITLAINNGQRQPTEQLKTCIANMAQLEHGQQRTNTRTRGRLQEDECS